MNELIGWAEVIDWVATIFSKRSRRDYPMILLLLLCATGCLATYALWFR